MSRIARRNIAGRPQAILNCSRAASRHPFSTTRQRPQAETAAQAVEEPEISRQQYEDLVNTYGAPEKPRTNIKVEERSPQHYRLAPRLALTPQQEDQPQQPKRTVLQPNSAEHAAQLRRLMNYLTNRKPGECTEKIWRAWSALPAPRIRYFTGYCIRSLLHHLAWVEKRELASSQRYFSVLEEALADSVDIGVSHWNTAVSFAGRWARKTTPDNVKAAIETWLRMEREGGVPADNVTFNILFDLAVKAGRFALADTIHAELVRRELPLNRYFRTSKIYYAGKRGDAENVRAAFRELVAAGEIIDTAVMNCVILSLAQCGEIASAEHVMAKMKRLHEHKFGTAALVDWREKKAMGKKLDDFSRKLRADRQKHLESFFGSPYFDDAKKEEMQRTAPIAPDELTYRILIQWHAQTSGNIEQIRTYIGEIEAAGYKVHHNVFYQLFKGFANHGGFAFTAWNRRSLEAYWSDYVSTVVGDTAAAEVVARVKARLKKPSALEENVSYSPLNPSDTDISHNEADVVSGAEIDSDDDVEPTPSHLAPMEFRPGPIMAALAAFYKCAGLRRMLEVWDEVQMAWKDMSDAERRSIEGVVAEKRKDAGVYVD